MRIVDLADRWTEIWTDFALEFPDPQVLQALLNHYCEPHRAYHTLRHLEECFAQFDSVRSLCVYPAEVQLALWFHDAFYNTKASDNEDGSASWAESVLATAKATFVLRQRVRDLILATKHEGLPSTDDARLLVDIDLSILGAPSERFDEYERQIRFEYSWVAEDQFRKARSAILSQFLERPAIYCTAHFRKHFENQARVNLDRSLARLGGISG